jgi:hypothetical protein
MFHVKHLPFKPCLQGIARPLKISGKVNGLVKGSKQDECETLLACFTNGMFI